MRKVENIEKQIGELSKSEFAELREWLLQRDCDAQIGADVGAGKLDKHIEESHADCEAGHAREL